MSKEVKRSGIRKVKRACGLCGKTRKLVKTPCCDNWICNDERNYVPFDYFSSCYRNHSRYTLCAFHHTEGHEGKWQECEMCKGEFTGIQLEDFANGSFNFEKLDDFSKITCVVCGYKSESKEDFPFQLDDDYYCTKDECQRVGKSPSDKSKRKAESRKVSKAVVKKVKKACSLCGETKKLWQTDCCGYWVCDLRSRNKCHMSHRKYSLCAYHCTEGHEGNWQECLECSQEFTGIDFEDFANGHYTIEKLKDYPKITRTCVVCGLKSETLKDFAFKIKDEFYCTKDECQQKNKPPVSNDNNSVAKT